MKIYDVRIRHADGEENTSLVKLETPEESQLYQEDRYDELFKDSEYNDDDIYFFFDSSDMIKENGHYGFGEDWFKILEIKRVVTI